MSNNRLGTVYGTPQQDITTWDGQQGYDITCAVRDQEFIIELFTGQEVDENALVQEALDRGWLEPGNVGEGGTAWEYIGNLLELHGIAVNRYTDANVFQLADELAQGHKVIVGVDSRELWQEKDPALDTILDDAGLTSADHAVVVSGIDTSNPEDMRVLVSDPGTGEALASYPLQEFLNAWSDSDFFMVATQEPAPAWLPGMANFPYEQGHIDEVLSMPYDEFATYADQPEVWQTLCLHVVEGTPSPIDGTESWVIDLPTEYSPIQYDQQVTTDQGVFQPLDEDQ